MKPFVAGLLIGCVATWGVWAAITSRSSVTRSDSVGSSEVAPRVVPVARTEPAEPKADQQTRAEPFAPGTAILGIGDHYRFGESRVRRDDGDVHCQDIRYGASLHCPHGALPAAIPLAAIGVPESPADVADRIEDVPTDLPRRDAWVRARPTRKDLGVALVRSKAGRTYKVWLIEKTAHPDALQRRVHLGWAEVPVRERGGVAKLPTSIGNGNEGPSSAEIERIVAAGAAVPGDSFARQLQGDFTGLSEWPAKLSLQKTRHLVCAEPLTTEVAIRARGAIYAPHGIGPSGRVVFDSYAAVAVDGPMEGTVDVKSYGYVHIAGDLVGQVNVNSYATVVITGDIVGTLKVRSYTNLLLHGRIVGTLDAKGSCWSTFYLDGYYARTELEQLGDGFGSVTLHVRESDLAPGKHEKIGSWRSVIVGDPVWKKLQK
ncbi:MAG: hypothetical protein AAGD14_15940 [Planctomycetota bacterium]